MKPSDIRRMVASALFAAIICVATLSPVTTPMGGYIHLGDCFVLLAGWILGPVWGAAAGAVGSALTDLIMGYAVYVPATFVIKGLMASAAFWVIALIRGKSKVMKVLRYVIAAAAGEAIMVAGYFAYETALYGIGGAAANIPYNLVQGASGIVLSSFIIQAIMKIRYLNELNNKKN